MGNKKRKLCIMEKGTLRRGTKKCYGIKRIDARVDEILDGERNKNGAKFLRGVEEVANKKREERVVRRLFEPKGILYVQ